MMDFLILEMKKKKDGFAGQRAIVLPRKILSDFCINNVLMDNIYVTDIGYYPKAYFHFRERPKGSDQNILIYCSDGNGTVRIKNENYSLTPSTFIFIPKGVTHNYAADEKNPWTIYWVHFSGKISSSLIESFRKSSNSLKGSIDFQESRINLFEDIYSNLEMGYSNNNLCYANLCLQFFLSSFIFNDNYNYVEKKQSRDIITYSIKYMQQNTDKIISLQSIAKTANLSVSHFTNLFKKKTGFPPIEYFNHIKIQKACQYLLFTDLRVKEIADKLGIEDQYYFSRMFTKLMGISPINYRIKRAR